MTETQREVRVSGDSTEAPTEGARASGPAVATVAGMLANPRRIRRS